MALDELLRNLESEAAERVEDVLRRAREEADRLRREGRADGRRRRVAAGARRRTELRAAAAREIEAARHDATRRRLEARSTVLERIRTRTRARLRSRADDPALLPGLRRDLAEALSYLGDGPVVVVGPAPQLARLREAGAGRAGLTFEPTDGAGAGLLLRSAAGTVTVDATLDGRLDQAWPSLAIDLASRLEQAL